MQQWATIFHLSRMCDLLVPPPLLHNVMFLYRYNWHFLVNVKTLKPCVQRLCTVSVKASNTDLGHNQSSISFLIRGREDIFQLYAFESYTVVAYQYPPGLIQCQISTWRYRL